MSERTPQSSSLRAQHVGQTRDSLVRAGRELFGQKGFRQTSVEDSARAARVTTGALYHHFPTKTALFEAVFEHAHTELMAASMVAVRMRPMTSTCWLAASRRSSTPYWNQTYSASSFWMAPRCWA